MRTAGLRLDQVPPLDIPLRFFLTAPLFGMAAGASLLLQGGALLGHALVPGMLACAHLVTLGWVTMTMVGALYQILPVLIGTPVPRIAWGRWVHAGLAGGTVALAVGLAAGAAWAAAAWATGIAAALLGLSLFTALAQFTVAAWRAPAAGATRWAIRLALAALAVTAALGLTFAVRQAAGNPLADRTAWIAVHAYWGLAGWIGALILGVGSAMLPMFYLTPQAPAAGLWLALSALAATLVSALLLPSGWLNGGLLNGGAWIPTASAILAYATLAGCWLWMLSRRRRTANDASLWLWRAALGWGAAGCVLLAWQQWAPDARAALVLGMAMLVGCAANLINAMLLKIVPFLVWLHRFSRNLGKTPVPLMGDLLPARHARRQAGCMFAATALLVLAGWLPSDVLARLAGAGLLLACGYLEWLLWRAWRAPAPVPAAPAASTARAS